MPGSLPLSTTGSCFTLLRIMREPAFTIVVSLGQRRGTSIADLGKNASTYQPIIKAVFHKHGLTGCFLLLQRILRRAFHVTPMSIKVFAGSFR
jgi:hypothetical protein